MENVDLVIQRWRWWCLCKFFMVVAWLFDVLDDLE